MGIGKELQQALLNYLATKPYAEVYQLIAGLVKAQEQQIENDSERDTKL